MGHTQDELFQRLRFYQFYEATDTNDSYALLLKQCDSMLGYNGHDPSCYVLICTYVLEHFHGFIDYDSRFFVENIRV